MFTQHTLGKKLLLSFLFFHTIISAQEVLSVDQLILKALHLSPELHISQSQYKTSKSLHNEAFANYLPKINLNAGAGIFGVSDVRDNKINNTINNSLVLGQLSLQQLVYDFGKTGGLSKSTQVDTEAYLANHEQFLSDKKKDVKNAYYDVLRAKSLLQVNRENVKLNKAQLYRSQKYFQAGIRTKIDISDANVELIKAKLALNDAQYTLKLAYAKLDKTIGYVSTTRDYSVLYQKIEPEKLDTDLQEYLLGLKEAIKYAYKNRYKIKQYQYLILSARAQEDIFSSEYYPQIYFNAQYTKRSISDKFAIFTPPTQYSAIVNFSWNLYAGGSSSAKAQAQRTRTKISEAQLILRKLEVKTEVTNAYINLNRVKDSVVLSKSLLNASKEKFNQAAKRYEHGLSDYIEFQQARQGYIDASTQLIINYYNYFKAIALLDNAVGR